MSNSEKMSGKKQVVIIGCGMAGMAAGRRLGKEGIDFEILEARDRVGGRVWSCGDLGDGIKVDLGGQWVHEASGENPTVKLMQEIGGLKWESRETFWDRIVFDYDGDILDNEEFGRARQLFNAAESFLGISKERLDVKDPGVSMWDVFEQYDDVKAIDFGKMESGFERALAYFIDREQCYEGGRMRELSTSLRGMYSGYGGGDKTIDGTYESLTSVLVEEIGMERIRLECVVTRIEYGEDGCKVTLSDGETIEAENVICTVPLGVLKAGSIEFSPELPSGKQKAIDTMGMGLLDKIAMRFTNRFWAEFHSFGYAAKNSKQIKWFFDQSERTDGEAVLLMFHGGDAARRMDDEGAEVTEEEMVAEAIEHLKLMFPSEEIELVKSVVTKWNTDPFSRGSYSFAAAGSEADCWDELMAPLERLCFAGEATVGWNYGCVHSAIQSGEREAQRVMEWSQTKPNKK